MLASRLTPMRTASDVATVTQSSTTSERGTISNEALAKQLTIPRDAVPGVNLVGFLEGELGLGEVARKLGRALEHAGIPFAAISYRRTPSRQDHPLELEPSHEAPYDTNVICLNADHLHDFLDDVGVDFFAGRYSIGVWFWESSVFRQENLEGLRFLDEVWVASEYVREAIAAVADVPVLVAPLPIEEPSEATHSRADLGLPEGFTFLFLFDFVSGQRKNPWAVVKAFKQAFASGEGPTLVVKSINGRERKPQLLDQLIAAADGRPDIHIVDAFVSAAEKDSYMAACDCFVSLHRSEGFGLPMADAMARGKPVIATGYSGNLDFMDERNSYLVPYRLVSVPEDWWAHAPGAEWAEPDVEAAAAQMREVYANPSEARALGKRGRASILSTMSLDRTAAFLFDHVEDVRHRRGSAETSAHDPRAAILQASHALEKGVAASLLDDTGPRPRFVRRLLARALWPYLADQQRFETSVLDVLTALQRSVENIEQRILRLEASGAQDQDHTQAPPTTSRSTSR